MNLIQVYTGGTVGNSTLGNSGELKLHSLMDVHQRGDRSTGLYGNNTDATFFMFHKDVEAKSKCSCQFT